MFVRLVPGATRAVLLLAASAVIAGAGVLTAAPAQAHNVLLTTTPADGATVRKVPAAVTLTFDQKVLGLGSAVEVTGPDGEIQVGDPEIVDDLVRQPVRAGAPAGDYTVAWRITSVDGHPISGTYTFTAVDGPAASTARAAATSSADASARGEVTDSTSEGNGAETNWSAVLLWGAAGGLLGTAFVLVQRRRKRRSA